MPATPRVETLADPRRYSTLQLDNARRIATAMHRGTLVLCEAPRL